MKKFIISILYIFIFVGICLAQNNIDKKIDSLQKEKVNANHALKQASDNLRVHETQDNYQLAKAAQKEQERIINELELALEEQKQANNAKAVSVVITEKAKEILASKYPEFINTDFKKPLLEKLSQNNNFKINNVLAGKFFIMINNDKFSAKEENYEINKAAAVVFSDPLLHYEYGLIKRKHKEMERSIRAYIKGFFGTEYKENIPLKCEHTLSYIDVMRQDPYLKCTPVYTVDFVDGVLNERVCKTVVYDNIGKDEHLKFDDYNVLGLIDDTFIDDITKIISNFEKSIPSHLKFKEAFGKGLNTKVDPEFDKHQHYFIKDKSYKCNSHQFYYKDGETYKKVKPIILKQYAMSSEVNCKEIIKAIPQELL